MKFLIVPMLFTAAILVAPVSANAFDGQQFWQEQAAQAD